MPIRFDSGVKKYDYTHPAAEKIKAAVPNCEVQVYDIDDEVQFKTELDSADIFVNATIVGMKPMDDQSIIKDVSWFRAELVVADIVYNPEETMLLKKAKAAGCETQNGLNMLLYQGEAAFRIWTGLDMPIEPIREKFFK